MLMVLVLAFIAVVGGIGLAKAGAAWKRGEVNAAYFWRIVGSVAFSIAIVLLASM